MDIQFNTGRLYTVEGQVIRALYDAEAEVIHFADFSRACNGTIQVPSNTTFRTPGGLAQFVMSRYDRGEYWNSTESWAILMTQGRQPTEIHQFTI
jgi:hypothetical protein